jgi:hypothetical protein
MNLEKTFVSEINNTFLQENMFYLTNKSNFAKKIFYYLTFINI